MKKLLVLLLAASMILSLAACGGGETASSADASGESEGSKLIGVCMQNMSSSINELQSEALKEMFEPLGYEVQVVSADDSVSNQTQQIQNFILMGAEMLVVLPCEIETLEDSLIQARENGIKVVISGGTGSISEDAYDAVSADDEFMIGMYVAAVTKTWVEQYMDPNGDWDVEFVSSTISIDAKSRCAGEFMIVEPYLKNEAGDFVNLMGEVVSETEKVENPVFCQMIADRVESIDECSTEMDIAGDNRSVVAGVLTDNPKARVIISYNSLASTAGSQYVVDTYPQEQWDEFAFFSAGVMGDEYEYLIGSVTEDAGTRSLFRAACQFGGGDAAATLANLSYNVMFGEAGVDYGKANPNSIGLFYPLEADVNGGTPALVCFDTPSYIRSYTYEEVLAEENLMTYWDAQNGYNADAQQESPAAGPVEIVPIEGGQTYICEYVGGMGPENHAFDLMDDGTCKFYLPGNAMIVDQYAGTYTVADDGVTVEIKGLTNIDTSSAYTIPGLWPYIDSTTGDATIIINPDDFTYTVPGAETSADAPAEAAPEAAPIEKPEGAYTCEVDGLGGKDTLQFILNEDGTCQFSLPGNAMIVDQYAGTYTRDGDTVTIIGLRNVDESSAFQIPGLWAFIDSATGDAVITVNDADFTFQPQA